MAHPQVCMSLQPPVPPLSNGLVKSLQCQTTSNYRSISIIHKLIELVLQAVQQNTSVKTSCGLLHVSGLTSRRAIDFSPCSFSMLGLVCKKEATCLSSSLALASRACGNFCRMACMMT